MKLFDCDMAYGRGAARLPREVETVDELVAEMDHCGIEEALVWHRDSFERDFGQGNQRLAVLDAYPRLHRTATFVPTCCDEMQVGEDFLKQMHMDGVRAVRAFPARHCFLLDPISCGDLLDLFSAYSIPIIVPFPEIQGGWTEVYRLMRDFPKLPLVLTETGCWGEDRYFRPLMRTYPRFFITMNRLETAGQLKSIVDRVGDEHIMFGSGLPRNYPGGYVMSLLRAEISDGARASIAHENIERLLKEVPW